MNPIRTEPVVVASVAMLATVVAWFAGVFGLDMPWEVATAIAGLLWGAATWYARQRVTPVDEP